MYIYIYIYIEREREIDIDIHMYMFLFTRYIYLFAARAFPCTENLACRAFAWLLCGFCVAFELLAWLPSHLAHGQHNK